MRRILLEVIAGAALLALSAEVVSAGGQMGGYGGMGGAGVGRPGGMSQPVGETAPQERVDKPDAAANKAYKAGMKTLAKAAAYDSAATSAPNEDKKNAALGKRNDAYGKALDQFTEALSNKGDLYDAWNQVGYVHLKLGAYAESMDDYNHALALQPDLLEAVAHRGEAYVAIDRLDDAKAAYMEVFNHDKALAAPLMTTMQQWVTAHRNDPHGMRSADIDAFDKWVQERNGIARQTAALPP